LNICGFKFLNSELVTYSFVNTIILSPRCCDLVCVCCWITRRDDVMLT